MNKIQKPRANGLAMSKLHCLPMGSYIQQPQV